LLDAETFTASAGRMGGRIGSLEIVIAIHGKNNPIR